MATQTPLDKKIKSILRYNTSYPYFGTLKFSELYEAQGAMRRNEYYNANGTRDARIQIGKINGDVICGALWRLMGYNPGRFTSNPFSYSGRNNIFKFVKNRMVFPDDFTTTDIVDRIRRYLREYLITNATENGQWQDEITTMDGGYVYTVLIDGRTGPMYKKLCLLRQAVKLISAQNCADYDSKRGPYRAQIIQAVQSRHPELFGITPANTNTVAAAPIKKKASVTEIDTTKEEIAADKIIDKMEQLQIILDNESNVSSDLYDQAVKDMAKLRAELLEIRRRHTL